LAEKGADINKLDNYGFFALKREVIQGQIEMIKKLLARGADIENRDEFGRTVLHLAMNRYRENSNTNVIQILLTHGASLNAVDNKGRTPLHYLFVKSNR
jgi:ankyrin repeat protein